MVIVDHLANRLSYLMKNLPSRRDWSEANLKIRNLEPGETVTVECPVGISMGHMRSVLLSTGKRYHLGEWRISSKRDKNRLHFFLAPARKKRE